MAGITDLSDFFALKGEPLTGTYEMRLTLNMLIFPKKVEDMAKELVDSVVKDEAFYQRFVAATEEQVKQDAAQFEQVVPEPHKILLKRFYQGFNTLNPEAYQQIKPYRTALGYLDDRAFKIFITNFIPVIKAKIKGGNTVLNLTRHLETDNIYCHIVRGLSVGALSMIQCNEFNHSPITPQLEQLWFDRYRNCYVRLLHQVDPDRWYQFDFGKINLRRYFDQTFFNTLLKPYLRNKKSKSKDQGAPQRA